MEPDPPSNHCEFEAVFPFDGHGLSVRGSALGRRIEFDSDDGCITIALPGLEHVRRGLDDTRALPDQWWKRARLTHGRVDDDEVNAASVERFEVRVQVVPEPGQLPTDFVKHAFPLAAAAAEHFLAWIRASVGQFWLPPWHEGPDLAAYGELVVAGTYEEVAPEARWQTPHRSIGIRLEAAASAQDVDDALQRAATGGEPEVADLLLADARMVLSPFGSSQASKIERRDTARAVLVAAIAAEVKIKETLVEKTRHEFHELLDLILDNPRDITIAAGQLLDKPMKAALGVSLREQDRPLFKDVTERTSTKWGLFPLRNRVAHYGYRPTLAEAQKAVDGAQRLFAWLDSLAVSDGER